MCVEGCKYGRAFINRACIFVYLFASCYTYFVPLGPLYGQSEIIFFYKFQDFTDELIKDEALPEDQKDAFKVPNRVLVFSFSFFKKEDKTQRSKLTCIKASVHNDEDYYSITECELRLLS